MAAAVHLYEGLGFQRAPAFDLQATDMMAVDDPDGPLVIADRRELRPSTYALGHPEGETQRLVLQHQIYAPLTRQLLTAAGVTARARVRAAGWANVEFQHGESGRSIWRPSSMPSLVAGP
jgi:hypothetical protein